MPAARRFLATLAAEAELLLINVDWIRDLAILATAPLDNVINSNWLPLPGSVDEVTTRAAHSLPGSVSHPGVSRCRGFERTEVKLGIEPGAHDDPITYHRLTK